MAWQKQIALQESTTLFPKVSIIASDFAFWALILQPLVPLLEEHGNMEDIGDLKEQSLTLQLNTIGLFWERGGN